MTSESEPDKEYPLSLDRFGRWRCDCMDWVMKASRTPVGQKVPYCKHIKKQLEELGK